MVVLPRVELLPSFKPGYCKVERENKPQATAQGGFTLALHPTAPETQYEY